MGRKNKHDNYVFHCGCCTSCDVSSTGHDSNLESPESCQICNFYKFFDPSITIEG